VRDCAARQLIRHNQDVYRHLTECFPNVVLKAETDEPVATARELGPRNHNIVGYRHPYQVRGRVYLNRRWRGPGHSMDPRETSSVDILLCSDPRLAGITSPSEGTRQ
jgi:hypothetical protein